MFLFLYYQWVEISINFGVKYKIITLNSSFSLHLDKHNVEDQRFYAYKSHTKESRRHNESSYHDILDKQAELSAGVWQNGPQNP
jgi:hypothetical protein